MSGPIEPYRSRSLSKAAVAREQNVALNNLHLLTYGVRVGRNLPDDLEPLKPRETRERDRSLRGKARRRARQGRAA